MVDEIASKLLAERNRLLDEWQRVIPYWRDEAARDFEGMAVTPLAQALDETAQLAREFAAAVRAAWASRSNVS
jgi:hypothetical protein